MKILFGCGVYFGFRGNEEHTSLEASNITFGQFGSRHLYAGYDYFGIDGLVDKTHRLGFHKSHARDTKDCMRVPVMDNDPKSGDLGGSIKRFLDKLAPGQIRLYCKIIPPDQRKPDSDGNVQVFYASSPLGKDTICNMFKEGAAILGLKDCRIIFPPLNVVSGTQSFNSSSVSPTLIPAKFES